MECILYDLQSSSFSVITFSHFMIAMDTDHELCNARWLAFIIFQWKITNWSVIHFSFQLNCLFFYIFRVSRFRFCNILWVFPITIQPNSPNEIILGKITISLFRILLKIINEILFMFIYIVQLIIYYFSNEIVSLSIAGTQNPLFFMQHIYYCTKEALIITRPKLNASQKQTNVPLANGLSFPFQNTKFPYFKENQPIAGGGDGMAFILHNFCEQ